MSKRPNILLITSDQHHFNALGYINSELRTPNLDRLAKSGTVFTRAYCSNPTCTPARASIITGMYPSQHGAYSLGTKLPENVPTLGDFFHQGGYRSALIGKAHFQQLLDHTQYRSIESNPLQQNLNFWRTFTGPFYGFDHVELCRNHTDESHVGQHYALWMEAKGFDWQGYFSKPAGTADCQRHKWNLPEEYHYDAWIAERTNAMMEEYAENGDHFFLWASFPDPHPSYLVPEPWDTMYDPDKLIVPQMHPDEDFSNMPPHYNMTRQKEVDGSAYEEPDGNGIHGLHSHLHDPKQLAEDIAVYYGMVSMMDKYIGKILDKLEELGLADNTIVVFTTDHGHFHGHHGLTAKCIFHYEDMLKIPFVVSSPGRIPADRQSQAMQSLVDLAPTVLDFCDLEVPRCMTGVSQKQVWQGTSDSARNHVVVENRHQPTTMNIRSCINERYKITVYYNREYGELFDLEQDPGELTNLWNSQEHQDLKKDLLLKFIHAEMGNEPVLMPRVWCA
ncbi:MAG: sulfatase-like hydrolase/transferase [Victivallales bacterium]|nr:sulfatase-like hydrolase/transferase [Victivallales bacterium]